MTEIEPEEDYLCGKCDATEEWNDDCIRCMVERHIELNKEAYQKMGEIP